MKTLKLTSRVWILNSHNKLLQAEEDCDTLGKLSGGFHRPLNSFSITQSAQSSPQTQIRISVCALWESPLPLKRLRILFLQSVKAPPLRFVPSPSLSGDGAL